MVILFTLLVGGILFFLQRILYAHWWSRGVTVRLSFEKETVHAGEQVKLFEMVENHKSLPLSSLKVKFQCSRYLEFSNGQNGNVTDKYYRNDIFTVMPYQRVTRTHEVNCPKRGYYGIEGINLVGADLFFSEEMTADRTSDAVVHVIPKVLSMNEMEPAFRKINGEIATKRYELEDPFTFRGIREYAPYDEMKRISWKATAKTDELKVREREHTAVSSVRIFMNLEDYGILRRQELLEMSISLCAGLAEELLREGIRISIYANAPDCIGGQLLTMEELTHPACMETINKAFARLNTEEGTVKFGKCLREKLYEGNSVYTIFISPDQHEDFVEEIANYREEAGDDFVWICPVKKLVKEKNVQEKIVGKIPEHRIILVEEPS